MSLNRYEHANIKNLIDGYMVGSRPYQSREDEFNLAKEELLANLKKQIENVEQFGFDDFCKRVK